MVCLSLTAPADSAWHYWGPNLVVQIQVLPALVTVVLPWKVPTHPAAHPGPSLILLYTA